MPQTLDPAGAPADFALPVSAEQDRERAYRRQAAAVELSRRAIAPNVHLLVQDAAALIAESLSVERFGFAELSDDRTSLEMRLAPVSQESSGSDAPARPTAPRQLSLDPSRSLAAHSLQAGEVVAVRDFATERRFADEWLLKQGVRSAVVVPLRVQDQSYGVIGAFGNRPQQFAHDDLLFAEMIAHLVSTNIARERADKTLESERRFTTTVLETVDALVLVLTPAGRIIRANKACGQITGYSCDEVRDRTIWTALLVPGEADAMKRIFSRLQSDPGPHMHEGFLLTKHAERRRITWSFGLLTQSGGEIETILATGTDITERRVAEEEVERLKTAEADTSRRARDRVGRARIAQGGVGRSGRGASG